REGPLALLEDLNDLPALGGGHGVAQLPQTEAECLVVELRGLDAPRQPAQVAALRLAGQVLRLVAGQVFESRLARAQLRQRCGGVFLGAERDAPRVDLLLRGRDVGAE